MSAYSNQFDLIDKALRERRFYRGHVLTPWRPNEDAGASSGRPCLTLVQFRALPGADGERDTLHLVTTWRSRDLFGAYPLNAAAMCLWLCETANRHGMDVGTYTDISVSGHIYERDYAAAQAAIKGHKPPTIRWDQRTSWRVERTEGLRATALTPNGTEVVAVLTASTPGNLRLQIERSGLVTCAGAALWLGAEIERVWSEG